MRAKEPHDETTCQECAYRHPTAREGLILIQPETRVLRVAITRKDMHQRPRKGEDQKRY